MYIFRKSLNVFFLVVFAQFAPTVFSAPVSAPVPAFQDIASTEKRIVKADGALHEDTLPPNPLRPRVDPRIQRIAVPGTQVVVQILRGQAVGGNLLDSILLAAFNTIVAQVGLIGDGVIAGGQFSLTFEGVVLHVFNSNNHQLTRGVLGTALAGLRGYMSHEGEKFVAFEIFDGVTQVGAGMLTRVGRQLEDLFVT